MLYTATQYRGGPIALRYPRGNGVGVPLKQTFNTLEIGRGEIVRPGDDVAILAIGDMVYPALKAAELLSKDGINSEVVNMRFVKPIDDKLVQSVCSRFGYILTVENHIIHGGFGSAVLEAIASNLNPRVHVKVLGVPDEFIEQGTPQELLTMLKLDPSGIASTVKNFFRQTPKHDPAETMAQ